MQFHHYIAQSGSQSFSSRIQFPSPPSASLCSPEKMQGKQFQQYTRPNFFSGVGKNAGESPPRSSRPPLVVPADYKSFKQDLDKQEERGGAPHSQPDNKMTRGEERGREAGEKGKEEGVSKHRQEEESRHEKKTDLDYIWRQVPGWEKKEHKPALDFGYSSTKHHPYRRDDSRGMAAEQKGIRSALDELAKGRDGALVKEKSRRADDANTKVIEVTTRQDDYGSANGFREAGGRKEGGVERPPANGGGGVTVKPFPTGVQRPSGTTTEADSLTPSQSISSISSSSSACLPPAAPNVTLTPAREEAAGPPRELSATSRLPSSSTSVAQQLASLSSARAYWHRVTSSPQPYCAKVTAAYTTAAAGQSRPERRHATRSRKFK